jgi:hypothetical protein
MLVDDFQRAGFKISKFQRLNVNANGQVSRLPGELGVLSGLMSDKKEIARQGERSKLGNFETLKL